SSAPVDASRYLKAGPMPGMTFTDLMSAHDWIDIEVWNYRNPEKTLLFTKDVSDRVTGSSVSDAVFGLTTTYEAGAQADKGATTSAKMIFSGLYGADRNFNQRLDRGPLPATARMRAMLVARFNFYDPRVHLSVR